MTTYMSGIGGGSAMVIAPLAFAAVGVVPELIAAMSLGSLRYHLQHHPLH